MKKEKTMTPEQFDLLTKEDVWIDAIAKAHKCCDTEGNFKHLKTCTYPDEYIVTQQMKDEATRMAIRRREEILSAIQPGELCFVSMGMDTDGKDSIEDGVNNHRVRCFFRNDKGDKYFVEFLRGGIDGTFFLESATDCAAEEEYNRLMEETARWNREHLVGGPLRPYPGQDCYNPFDASHTQYNKPFTWTNVLEVVNGIFGCSYTSARKIDHFVSSDMFTNVCK